MCSSSSSTPPPTSRDFTREEIATIIQAAETGSSADQYQLSILYKTGVGVTQNNEKAKFWLRKSATQGYPYAQLTLGKDPDNSKHERTQYLLLALKSTDTEVRQEACHTLILYFRATRHIYQELEIWPDIYFRAHFEVGVLRKEDASLDYLAIKHPAKFDEVLISLSYREMQRALAALLVDVREIVIERIGKHIHPYLEELSFKLEEFQSSDAIEPFRDVAPIITSYVRSTLQEPSAEYFLSAFCESFIEYYHREIEKNTEIPPLVKEVWDSIFTLIQQRQAEISTSDISEKLDLYNIFLAELLSLIVKNRQTLIEARLNRNSDKFLCYFVSNLFTRLPRGYIPIVKETATLWEKNEMALPSNYYRKTILPSDHSDAQLMRNRRLTAIGGVLGWWCGGGISSAALGVCTVSIARNALGFFRTCSSRKSKKIENIACKKITYMHSSF